MTKASAERGRRSLGQWGGAEPQCRRAVGEESELGLLGDPHVLGHGKVDLLRQLKGPSDTRGEAGER